MRSDTSFLNHKNFLKNYTQKVDEKNKTSIGRVFKIFGIIINFKILINFTYFKTKNLPRLIFR